MNKNNKTIIGIVAGVTILVISFGFVYFLIQGTYVMPTYTFSDSNLIISGQNGATINLSDATIIHELSTVPSTESKTKGAAIGKIEKGYFMINGLEIYLNIMDKDALNYIRITDSEGLIFLLIV